jgi:integrase
MSDLDSTTHISTGKPPKPTPDFPLFAHATKRWAKKIKGKLHYFGPWEDPGGSLERYEAFLAGKPIVREPKAKPTDQAKPAKPNPDYPLFPHASGRWAKKIRGETHYFGPWEDADGALATYLKDKDDLHAGRTPRPDADALRVKDVSNAFLIHKQALRDTGELSPHTWQNYKRASDTLVAHMGKARLVADLQPDDFASLRDKMSRKWGPHRLAVTIQHIRSIFKHAFEAGLIATPMRFGPGFKRPTKKTFRLHRAEQGARFFTAPELRKILAKAGTPMKAMILLGINCGMGNSDCGKLPLTAADLRSGWLDYPRPKTGIARRCPLWPETVKALREALANRHQPKDEEHRGLFFITKYGLPWAKDTPDNPITKEMRKLLDEVDINGHRNYYTLRHTFRTIADEARDQPAADFIMGHARDDMASVYREHIADTRLKAVSNHVRSWLFTAKKKVKTAKKKTATQPTGSREKSA